MLGKMGIPNINGKNTKVNMGAVQTHLNQNIKLAKMRERMKQKINSKGDDSSVSNSTEDINKVQSIDVNEENILKLLKTNSDGDIEHFIFSSGEKIEKSARIQNNNVKKNKKNKKK